MWMMRRPCESWILGRRVGYSRNRVQSPESGRIDDVVRWRDCEWIWGWRGHGTDAECVLGNPWVLIGIFHS
jgi:hypothetical protein